MVLNSKGEYNRCEIARLTLGEEGGGVDAGEEQANQEQEVREWVKKRSAQAKSKVNRVRKDNRVVEKIRERTKAIKKSGEEDDRKKPEEDDQPKRKKKKFAYEVLEKGWGQSKQVASNLQDVCTTTKTSRL